VTALNDTTANATAAAGTSRTIGAEVVDGGTWFRVWAPGHRSVTLVLGSDATDEADETDETDEADGRGTDSPDPSSEVALEPEAAGYWSALVPGVGAGTPYRFRVDGGPPLPDPTSRWQPHGPHGPSVVVDPRAFDWSDAGWVGPDPTRVTIYELHVGTFTQEGTFAAAAEHLHELADLGIGVVELLPVAEFPGRFGWGYDGVDLFAPMHAYGQPDDLRRFIDRAHAVGLAVILDVVYNHFGPDGWYAGAFSDTYTSVARRSEWGDTPNFDGPGSAGVRDFVVANVHMWVADYHVDGLRLDATQQIFDASADHILAAIRREVTGAASGRRTLVVAENEPQDARLVRAPSDGGYGLDALWNDDLHHSASVALTGRREAYYTDYRGSPMELVAAARHGFLYQGQPYEWQGAPRGTSGLDLSGRAFVAYLENHDQVSNSARGERIASLTSPGRLRALTAYLLLGPARPMLFMGQEWAASAPFTFFADHRKPLADQVDAGRREFLRQFPSLATPAALEGIPVPSDPATFAACRLDHAERGEHGHAEWLALHRDLLAMRRTWDAAPGGLLDVDGAVLTDSAFCLRFFPSGNRRGRSPEERLLVVNLGARTELRPAPEPLLAPPLGLAWEVALATDDPTYGGGGAADVILDNGWLLPAESAVVLRPIDRRPTRPEGRAGPTSG
jgi:maltooligosyltrehalose trehalohydrolase